MDKKLIPLYVGIFVITLLIVTAVSFLWIRKTTAPEFAGILPQKMNVTGDGPAKKTLEETSIDYWLYGKIVEVVSEDSDGLHMLFDLDGDPTGTRIPITIRWMDGWYKLLIYHKDFTQPYEITRPDGKTLRKEIADAPMVELRAQFLRSDITKEASDLMYQIEAANRGDWTHLPTSEFRADSVGVVKK